VGGREGGREGGRAVHREKALSVCTSVMCASASHPRESSWYRNTHVRDRRESSFSTLRMSCTHPHLRQRPRPLNYFQPPPHLHIPLRLCPLYTPNPTPDVLSHPSPPPSVHTSSKKRHGEGGTGWKEGRGREGKRGSRKGRVSVRRGVKESEGKRAREKERGRECEGKRARERERGKEGEGKSEGEGRTRRDENDESRRDKGGGEEERTR
jgi:hypothetical protein